MYSYYAPLDIKTSFALAQLRWRKNQPLGLKVHSSFHRLPKCWDKPKMHPHQL